MERTLVILANCDNYVELKGLEEFSRKEKVSFKPLPAEPECGFCTTHLHIDMEKRKWSYGRVIVDIGKHGEIHRDDEVIGVYDSSSLNDLKSLVADVFSFGKSIGARKKSYEGYSF